ncbi:MAG: dipeptide/oligopeptide/nickel ABC transporter permease/ATP-binding protein [Corynebacterium sp.]|nr:dipeptide/oligopeptide/nickel ABC transporter permease/ATP-binding protein [Corynebacterium sp.]
MGRTANTDAAYNTDDAERVLDSTPRATRRIWATPGTISLLVLTIVVLLGPWLAPQDPLATNLNAVLAAPSAEHWFGTDQLGRDLFSRVLAGGQRTVGISVVALLLSVAVGVVIGLVAGLRGKKTDWALMRIADSFLAFPEYVVAIVITGLMGAGYWNLLLAIIVVKWVGVARLVRAIVLEQRNQPYITAARLSGVPPRTIMTRHLLPHVWGPLIAFATVDVGKIVLLVASLSFLGLGVPRPAPEWGFMLNEGRAYITESTWIMLAPGLAILIFVLVSNVVGDNLAKRLQVASGAVPDAVVVHDVVEQAAPFIPAAKPVLQVRDLKVRTESRQLVHGVDFDLGAGQWVCIIGESGSGKSVTAMAITGLTADNLEVEASQVQIDGKDYASALHARDEKQLKELRGKKVAYVFQDYTQAFTPYFRIRTQLREILSRSRSQADTRIDVALAQVRLNPALADRYPRELSGGQLQRMALAAAILQEPEILICDEPTTALDAVTQAEVLGVISELQQRLGCAVLFITHDLRVARRYADQLVVMHAGQCIEAGPAHERMSNPQQEYTKKLFAAVPDLDNPPARLPEMRRAEMGQA